MNLKSIFISLIILSGCSGPLGPIAGGMLKGSNSATPANWDMIDNIEHIQLETINNGKPRSVLIWVGTANNKLYIATSLISGSSNPAARTWVMNVTDEPNVRARIDEQIYELKAVRVVNPIELEAARSAMMRKYDVAVDGQSSAAWIYELQTRE